MTAPDLWIRNGRDVAGGRLAVLVRQGRIAAIGPDVEAVAPELDAGGLCIGAGLHDHHLHLLATAARLESVDLSGCLDADAIMARLRARACTLRPDTWLRAIGYDERAAGLPDRYQLDSWIPDHPLRLQDRTGSHWFLNSAAIRHLGPPPYPDCVRLGADGLPDGRIFRGDAWLRERIGARPPPLAPLGQQLAAYGVTGVTDAGANNGPDEAALLIGQMPQRLVLMGSERLQPGSGYALGPLKLLLDESQLPTVAELAARIRTARSTRRAVAAHCVTLAELLVFLHALEMAGGAQPDDRIEHGAVIPASLIPDIAAARLMVVTQQNFIFERGDRYVAQISGDELPDLYRLRSLLHAGVPVLGGSDAPYGSIDPGVAMAAAMTRRSRAGAPIGLVEAVSQLQALALYQPALAVGMPADLILFDWPAISPAPRVCRTIIGGRTVWVA